MLWVGVGSKINEGVVFIHGFIWDFSNFWTGASGLVSWYCFFGGIVGWLRVVVVRGCGIKVVEYGFNHGFKFIESEFYVFDC